MKTLALVFFAGVAAAGITTGAVLGTRKEPDAKSQGIPAPNTDIPGMVPCYVPKEFFHEWECHSLYNPNITFPTFFYIPKELVENSNLENWSHSCSPKEIDYIITYNTGPDGPYWSCDRRGNSTNNSTDTAGSGATELGDNNSTEPHNSGGLRRRM